MYSFLVVSDDNIIHNFFKKSFKGDSVVQTTNTPEEALEILLRRDVDVAFLDILLKNDGASKLVEDLRKVNIDPTIVALIPQSQPMLCEEAVRMGAYELLETPLRKEALEQASRRALERRELRKELDFIQSQINKLKPVSKDNELSEYTSIAQKSTSNLHLTYKEVFQKFSKALMHVNDLRKLVDLSIEAIAEIFRVGKIVFMLIDKEKCICKPYRCLGLDEAIAQSICFSINHGTILWLSKNHQILNKEVMDREVAMNRLTRLEAMNIQKEIDLLHAQLCMPVFAKGNLVGVITLGNKITGKMFFDEDIELLSMLAQYIGMAVENALLYQEVCLRKIHNENVLENIPCGVITIDNECKINTFNKSAEKMLNIPSYDVLGKDVKHIGSVFANIILRTLKDKKSYEMSEIVYPTTHSTYAVSTSLLLDANKELGAIMIFSDLSEIKKLELRVKSLENHAFYNMLSRNMAHCIKNHLVPVKTFIGLFPERLEEKEFVEQFFPVVREKVNELNIIVERLTTLGENDGLVKRMVDLRLPLDNTLDSHKDRMDKLNIKLIKKYTEEPTITCADFQKLEEAFSNIILNAIEAMPNGGLLTVTLSKTLFDNKKLKAVYNSINNGDFPGKHNGNKGLNGELTGRCKGTKSSNGESVGKYNGTGNGHGNKSSKELQQKYIEIVVHDTGSGITQEEHKNIFIPFYTTKVHNIGLGLSIARRIIMEHAGFIYFSSKESEGSNFHLLLPVTDSQ
ncbi:MAG TPA: ATP-binding protein [Candidatus Hypogeohydataceae bacterium YC41]